jgi:hypothetical protein
VRNKDFIGRDFGKSDVEGYQLRVPREQIVLPPGYSREVLLNPACRYPLLSSDWIWPLALSYEDHKELQDPVVLLIPEEALPTAFYAVSPADCEVVLLRLIGLPSLRLLQTSGGGFDLPVPPGFEVCGFDVSEGWTNTSLLMADPHSSEDWQKLHSLTNGYVNEWSLLTDGLLAHEVGLRFGERQAPHGPFRAVLFATATREERLRRNHLPA